VIVDTADGLDADVEVADFERRTGWAIKPEGACKGDLCVPLPDGDLALGTIAQRLGMPVLHDDSTGVDLWSVGPATVTGKALDTAAVPADFELPDLDGNPFRLSSLHGRKVLLVAWASW
jgi:hypothetical protein